MTLSEITKEDLLNHITFVNEKILWDTLKQERKIIFIAGDIATFYADPSYAKEVLGWEAKRGIDEMCEDSWRWQSQNPNGYTKTY